MHDNMYNHLLLATPFLYRTKSDKAAPAKSFSEKF